jgi:hypothetical protein
MKQTTKFLNDPKLLQILNNAENLKKQVEK